MTGTVLTNNGLALITKLVAAKATLEFSRVAVGTGKVPQGVDPQAMISLNAYKMDAQISSYGVSPDQEDVAYIVTQVSSIGVSAGFAVTEGGVFANDPDKGEILFAYLDLTEDPQYVYAETDSISKFVEITFNVLIGSVEKVTAYVTPGALVKKVEFEELEKRVAETENPTFEDYTGDISVPTASAAIEEIKSKSKLGVLLSNIKAAFKGACLIGHIVNNCVTDNPNLPLSAAQGKALMDAITVLNTKSQFTGYVASTSCNYSGGTADFVIDISKLPLKRAGFLIICTSSTWAELYLLVVNAQELKIEQNTSGLTVIKIYNTYDKFEFKANAHEGNSNHVRINVKNTAGEACMVSVLAPYQS